MKESERELAELGEALTQGVSNEPPASAKVLVAARDSLELPQPIADPLIGVVVAERYRILEPLGRGGMGIVYKVEHARLGKLLAMKLLTGELSHNPEVVRRFKQEALTVSRLSSANTVQVFDFGVAEGLTYLVMELVAGEDLGRTLRAGGPLPFSRLGKIIIQACTSLAEAHQKGIVHRDMKPENIMLLRGRDGTELAKVLDFGLAKLREGAELNDLTSQGAIVGTPYYMAPEQVRGDPVDGRTDIYALGALMYRALTGHYPFNGQTPMAVFTKHISEAPVPPIKRAPERQIAPGVNRIILKALAKRPEARFQTVEELQAALVEETRAMGTSSVDTLLNSAAVRGLAQTATAGAGTDGDASGHANTHAGGGAGEGSVIATRDEVEAYERKLRRQRYGALVGAAVLAAAAVGLAVKLVATAPHKEFTGLEQEPNNTAGEAIELPLGRAVSGFLGKRLDAARSDRDFYALDVPAGAAAAKPGEGAGPLRAILKLKTSALPNMATCTLLYKQGLTTALGRYCLGRAGRDLVIPALRVEPGRYLVAVMQDQDGYGGAPPPVFENISDTYSLEVGPAEGDQGTEKEIEPNDQVASAEAIAPGAEMTAAIGWARDEDVFCAAGGAAGALRFEVTDAVRSPGAVLEVTPLRGTSEGAPVRVHTSGKGPRSDSDVMSPWQGPAMKPEAADAATSRGAPRCVRVRLVQDPWTSEKASAIPSGGNEAYVIKVFSAP